MTDLDPIPLSALQHWAYCPRQCGLIHLEQAFDDNLHTLRGNAVHRQVDQPGVETTKGLRVERALPLWHDQLGLIGKADAVEFSPTGEPYPVEYKQGSRNKAAAAKLVQFMAAPDASRFLAAEGALLPTYAEVYNDPEVLKNVPWFKDAGGVMGFGRSRPMSARYGEVSDALRTTTSAVLARTKKPEEGVEEIESRLRRVMR